MAEETGKCDNVICTANVKWAVAGDLSGGKRERESRTRRLTRSVAALIVSEDGQDLVEYGLVAALIALVGLASFGAFSGSVSQKIVNEFNTLGSYL